MASTAIPAPIPMTTPFAGSKCPLLVSSYICLDHLHLLTESLDGGVTITLTVEDRCVGCAKYEYVAPYSRGFCI